MDYVLGGVAALITGNVTPNRPRTIKKALTPTKHQPSPNVTPKSELVDDRSIFLSPTLQKKKAIVKKSPKRIFQNPDMDITGNEDSSIISPKADKAKKHLKDDLEADNQNVSLKRSKNDTLIENTQLNNENTPKKKKKNKDLGTPTIDSTKDVSRENNTESDVAQDGNDNCGGKKPKKMKQRRKSFLDNIDNQGNGTPTLKSVNDKNKSDNNNEQIKQDGEGLEKTLSNKKIKKHKRTAEQQIKDPNTTQEFANGSQTDQQDEKENQDENVTEQDNKKIKNKRRNRKQKAANNEGKCKDNNKTLQDNEVQSDNIKTDSELKKADVLLEGTHDKIVGKVKKNKLKKKKATVNPNAVTDKDSESEHGSDDEIESENEEINKKLLEEDPADSSSAEEEEELKQPVKTEIEKSENVINDPNEIKRTLFVGNVLFSKKCKKEIKRIFSKYGQIETVRIRTVPIKDARDTPKLAVIKNELHPDRSTVNVYVKFADEYSVEKALAENNTILNDHHLRVTRSDSTGSEHDPRCSVFVGNLPFALEDESLRAKFENCGEIDSVRIIRDKKTNAGKGFGYVNFKSKDGVELALGLSEEDLTIKNRILRVKRCTQGTQRQGNRFNQHRNRSFDGNKPFDRNRPFDRNKPFDRNRPFDRNSGNRRQEVGSFNRQTHNEGDGAHRRLMHKRKYQESGGEGPENKRQNTNQPRKEKKSRQEFVGMTAEKRKKHKFDKGQKKKKILSEILTKSV